MTLPQSNKSKAVAGLLQLLPGIFLSLGGLGRLYAGRITLGAVQLVATVIGWISFWCGFGLGFPFGLWAIVWLWFIIDGIVILVGQTVDGHGRTLH